MKTSEQVNELFKALSAAQAEVKAAPRDGDNSHFNSKYATLTSVWEVCRPPLAKHGLGILQSPSTSERGDVIITTRLTHASGQWIEGEFTLHPRDQSPQSYGSAVTYGRRFALMSFMGVAPEDDDGQAASTTSQTSQNAPQPNRVSPVTPQPQTAPPKVYKPSADKLVSEKQLGRLFAICKSSGWTDINVHGTIKGLWGLNSTKELNAVQYQELCERIEGQKMHTPEPLQGMMPPPQTEPMFPLDDLPY